VSGENGLRAANKEKQSYTPPSRTIKGETNDEKHKADENQTIASWTKTSRLSDQSRREKKKRATTGEGVPGFIGWGGRRAQRTSRVLSESTQTENPKREICRKKNRKGKVKG